MRAGNNYARSSKTRQFKVFTACYLKYSKTTVIQPVKVANEAWILHFVKTVRRKLLCDTTVALKRCMNGVHQFYYARKAHIRADENE